jgi:hypothetical protein
MNNSQKIIQLDPMDSNAFKKHIAKSLLIQTAVAIFIFIIIKYLKFDVNNISFLTFFSVISVMAASTFFYVFDPRKYKRRFKHIYPDSDPGYVWYLAAMLIPLFFFGITLFLCFKEPVSHIRTSLKLRTVSLFFVPVFCLQLTNPTFSNFSAGPSFYYVVDTTQAAANIIGYKKRLKNSDFVVENYLTRHGDKMKSTEQILLLAVAAAEIIKDKSKIDKKSNKARNTLASIKYGERLVSNIIDIYYLGNRNNFDITSYSPIQWLHPGGAFEILLLEGIENGIMNKFHREVSTKNLSMITNMEKKIDRLPAGERIYYRERFQKHRESILESGPYKEALREKAEKSFPIK